jgi:acyl-CoA thioesterase superfamily protein/acyl-Coa thioesterase superfamily protein
VADLPEAFYLPAGANRFEPTRATMSPWDEQSQHGGPPSALAAQCVDGAVQAADMRLARLSVDFLGAIPRRAMLAEVRILRPGRRIQLTEATLSVDGRPVLQARAWHVRAAGRLEPAGRPSPPPPVPEAQPLQAFGDLSEWGYGEAIDWRFTDGGFQQLGPAAVWTRLRIPLVAGTVPTGVSRALVVADAANGLSGELPFADWLFVPVGLTVSLVRPPTGDWVHLAAATRRATDGIGLTRGMLSDQADYIGEVGQPLLIAAR